MRGSTTGLPDARPRETFEALPVTLDLSPSRAVAAGRVLVAVLLFVFAGAFRFNLGAGAAADSVVATVGTAIPLGLGAVALWIAGRGVILMMTRREARFDASSVRVTGRTPFGREEWSQPLSAFEGAAWRTVRRRRRRGPDRIYQVIELRHPEPGRTLPLHVRQTSEPARAEWEAIARTLRVPAIDLRGGAAHTRHHEDLDKSLSDLAAEGKIGHSWQPGAEPPAGLSWESTGDGPAASLVVRLHARRFPALAYVAALAIGGFVVFVGVADRAVLAVLIGAALIGAVAWYWLTEPRRPRELRVTREEVRLTDPMPLGQDAGPLRLDAIEEIRVAPPPGRLAGATLVIASDAGEIRTGRGLSDEALEWLRDYLTAAVVEA